MRRTVTSAFMLAMMTACSPAEPGTTDTLPTTSPTSLPSTSTDTTTSDDSTSTDAETTEVNTSTTSPTTGDETTSTTDPLNPAYCLPNDPTEGEPVTCELQHREWCAEVASLATKHLPAPYDQHVIDACEVGATPACELCFRLSNTCSQVGDDCDGLLELCGCLAAAHGEVSP